MDRKRRNFLYALIYTIYRLALLPVIFLEFVIELWPLIDIKVLNDRVSANFKHAFIFAESRLGLLPVIFHKFVTELWSLIDVLQHEKCCSQLWSDSLNNFSMFCHGAAQVFWY